jgi:hypothetical protein
LALSIAATSDDGLPVVPEQAAMNVDASADPPESARTSVLTHKAAVSRLALVIAARRSASDGRWLKLRDMKLTSSELQSPR